MRYSVRSASRALVLVAHFRPQPNSHNQLQHLDPIYFPKHWYYHFPVNFAHYHAFCLEKNTSSSLNSMKKINLLLLSLVSVSEQFHLLLFVGVLPWLLLYGGNNVLPKINVFSTAKLTRETTLQ